MTSVNNNNAYFSNEDVHDKQSRKIISGKSLLRRCRSEYQNEVHRPLSGLSDGKPYAKSLMGLDDRRKADVATGGESLPRRRTAVHKSSSMPHVNRLSLKRSSPKEWDEEPVTVGKRSLFVDHSTEKMEVVYEEFTSMTDSDAAVVNDDSFNWGGVGSMQDLAARVSQSTVGQLSHFDGINLRDDQILPDDDQCDEEKKSYQKWKDESDNNRNNNNNSIDENEKSTNDDDYLSEIGTNEESEDCGSRLEGERENYVPRLVEERDNCVPRLVEERKTCSPRVVEEEKICAPRVVEEREDCVPRVAEERGAKRMHSESIEDIATLSPPIFELNLRASENGEPQFLFEKSVLHDVQHPFKGTQSGLPVVKSGNQSELKSREPSKSREARISEDDDLKMEESSRQPEATENDVEMEQSTTQTEEAISRSSEDDIPIPRSCFQQPEPEPVDRSKEDEPPAKRSILQNIMQKFSNFNKPSSGKHVVFEPTTNLWD